MSTPTHPALSRWSRGGPLALLLSLGFLALVVPHGIAAQDQPDSPVVVECEADRIECFAQIYIELNEIRDDLHRDLAEFHEESRRQDARRRADTRIEELFERFEVGVEEYEEFIRRIGLEQELRDAFEEVVERLIEGGS